MQNSNRKKEKEREIIQNNEILEIDGEMKNGVSWGQMVILKVNGT